MKSMWKKVLAVLCTAAMLMTAPGICVLADEIEQEEITVSEAEQIPEEAWAAEEPEEITVEEAADNSEQIPEEGSAKAAEPAEIPEEAAADVSIPAEEPADTVQEDSSEGLVDTQDFVEEELVGATVTRDNAKEFMDKYKHTWLSTGSGECVELYNQYLKQVFREPPPSLYYAYQIYDKSYPSGWTKIPANKITTYKVGDIVVYNAGNGVDVGYAGHVALVYSVDNGNVKLLEQNWAGVKTAELYNLHTARLKGIIRPKFDKIFYVTYNANGGSGSMAKQTFVYGTGGHLRKNTFTRSGYKFVGWNLYKPSNNTWDYTSGWYAKGKQPSGANLVVYKDEAKVAWTTDINKDTIEMNAVWEKNQTEDYGEWTPTKPPADGNTIIQEKTQYRYATRELTWQETGSGTIDYAVKWTSGFNKSNALYTKYNKTPKTASETSTEKVTVKTSKIGYIYYHWCMGKVLEHTYNRTIESNKTNSHQTFHAFFSNSDLALNTSANARKFDNYSKCQDTYWWLDERITINRCSYTTYKKSAYTNWSSWSSWQDNAVSSSDTVKVETRKVYRTVTMATMSGITPVVIFCSDVQDAHPYNDAILWAMENSIAKGYSDGTFGIDRDCTRGEMMMFLWRYAGKPSPKVASKSPFPDVPTTHAFYNAILWGSQKGITKGYPDGTFGISRNVSRGESMMFLWRLKGKPAPTAASASPFKDVPKNHAFYNAILWGSQKGITTGYTSGDKKGTFGINENCSRGAIVTFLYRARAIDNTL